ncbi:MAG TPA: RNA methyltransferase, partial [Beijerinckiaceae bacterium]|nr:RNA methyltransferase [Beijerinckiaceae bacterium]
EAGLDVDIRGHGPVDAAARLALVDCAERFDLARLAIHGETLVERRPPLLGMGRAQVNAPPGGFLQATQAGEEILAELVRGHTGRARKVVDLFCGVGPFALRLAETASVVAYDSDRAAIAALLKAARGTPGLKPVTAEARDLFRRPLLAPELNGHDVAVLDPPRAGAEAQARLLGLSRVPKIVYVSCDTASFLRDARLLAGLGLTLDRVTPVDQFAFTPHLELVGVFSRSR